MSIRHRALLGGLLLSLCMGTALGQTTTPTATPEAPPADAPLEVPSLASVSELTQTTQQLADQARAVAANDSDSAALREQYTTMRGELRKLQQDTRALLGSGPRVEQLQATRQEWAYLRDALQQQLNAAKARVSELEGASRQLKEQQDRWQAVLEQIASGALSNEARRPASRADTEINAAMRVINSALREAVALEFQWQELLSTSSETLDGLKKNEVAQRAAMFSNLEAPLWALGADDFQLERVSPELFWQQLGLLGNYADQKRANLVLLAIIAFTVLAFMMRLRTRPDSLSHLREGERLRFALVARPFSTTAACVAALGLLMFPQAPQLLRALLALLMFLPVVRLGMPLIHPRLRVLVWLISLLYLVDTLSALVDSVPGLDRLWNTGAAALAVSAALYTLRKMPAAAPGAGGPQGWRILRTLLWLSLPISGAALVAGVVGASALSDFLVSALINSSYLALALLVVAGIVADFLSTFLYLPFAQRSNMVRYHRWLLASRIRWLVGALSFVLWAIFVADQFLIRDAVWHSISGTLGASIEAGNISISLGDVLAVGLTIWLSLKLSRLLRFVFEEDVVPRTQMQRGVPTTISTLMHYSIILVGVLIAIGAAGIDLSKVAILAGALGVGIGIGLQDVVNNFTSGLILMFEQHLKHGDIVQTDTAVTGKVISIGLRSSIVRTFDGAEVIVPNSKLVSAQVINWTRSDQSRRIVIPIGAAYGSHPERVCQLLRDIASNDPDVMQDPAPSAYFLRFGPSSLDFELRAWVANSELLLDVTNRLCTGIINGFAENGIEIPFPQQDIHLRSISPGALDALRLPRGHA